MIYWRRMLDERTRIWRRNANDSRGVEDDPSRVSDIGWLFIVDNGVLKITTGLFKTDDVDFTSMEAKLLISLTPHGTVIF